MALSFHGDMDPGIVEQIQMLVDVLLVGCAIGIVWILAPLVWRRFRRHR